MYQSRLLSQKSTDITALNELGLASFNLNKTSAVNDAFTVIPDLKTKPIPTNKWWQNAVSAKPWPQTLYNLPLATNINENGLSVSIPDINASADTISSTPLNDVFLKPYKPASRTLVKSFDDLSVEVSVIDGNNNEIYSTKLIKGLPYVYANFSSDLSINISRADSAAIEKVSGNRSVARISFGAKKYAVYVPSTTSIKQEGDQLIISASKDIVVASIPTDSSDSVIKQFDSSSEATVSGATVTHNVNNSDVNTTIKYITDSTTSQTLVAVLPHQTSDEDKNNYIANINTVRGLAKLKVGNEISYKTAIPKNELTLNLPNDSNFFSKTTLNEYINQDAQKVAVSGLSYDGGKELYRLANLAMIAHQSGSSQSSALTSKLKDELSNWLTYSNGEKDKYFYYDRNIKGLVAAEPQYGSGEFNDHHFHYGYFLYAAAILGEYDSTFVKDYGKAVSAIGNDVAGEGSGLFSRYRTFDAYEGHSWAGGLTPFADGNNQESISEAVNAWFGLMQWSRITNDKQAEDTAKWLYANEASAALNYYYQNSKNPFPENYQHTEISLVWGGKSDWATWFSVAPEAKHAIIMLPLSGGSQYLKTNNAVATSINSLDNTLRGQPRSAYQDILLLGQSLSDPKKAQSEFSPDLKTDNSNTLSYIYYYLGWADK